MAKWEEEDRRTIALRGDVIAIALRPSPLLFAGSSSYLEILLGTFNNSVETDATWRHGGRRLFRGKKEKRGKKKIKAGSHARMEYETIRKTEASGGEGLIIVPLDK